MTSDPSTQKNDLQTLQDLAIKFRDDRDWKQYHNPKDSAISLCLEAAELLEHFQWRNGVDLEKHLTDSREEVADEICDVLYWVLVMARDLGYDLPSEFRRKVEKSSQKYPVEKVKGQAKKWTEL